MMLHKDQYKIPATLERSILFTTVDLQKLEQRKIQLRADITGIAKESSKLVETKNTLKKQKDILSSAYKEALAECEEIYQLKFGERIPQEILDGLEPT